MSELTWGEMIAGIALGLFPLIGLSMVMSIVQDEIIADIKRWWAQSPRIVVLRGVGCAVVIVFFMWAGIQLAVADKRDAASWETFVRVHKCAVVDTRTRSEYRSGGYPGTSHTERVTEYLWRCDNGEQWHR